MDPVVFGILEKDAGRLKRRTYRMKLRFAVPLILVTLVFCYATLYEMTVDDKQSILFSAAMSVPLIGFAIWLGLFLGHKRMLTFQLVLSDEGVERTMQGVFPKMITWDRLQVRPSKDGDLVLSDSHVSRFMQWWNGKGKIVVPQELDNFDKLVGIISEVKKERTQRTN